MERRRGGRPVLPALGGLPIPELTVGAGPVSLDVEAADGAPCYLGITSNCKSDPLRMDARRLRTIGIEPKNNVVDITNYVLTTSGSRSMRSMPTASEATPSGCGRRRKEKPSPPSTDGNSP